MTLPRPLRLSLKPKDPQQVLAEQVSRAVSAELAGLEARLLAALRKKRGFGIERTISVQELSELLGVAVKTIYGWKSDGRIPKPLNVPGTVRWDAAEIEDWLRGEAR